LRYNAIVVIKLVEVKNWIFLQREVLIKVIFSKKQLKNKNKSDILNKSIDFRIF